MDKSIHTEKYNQAISLIRESRIKAGITQEGLADKLSETQTFVSKCERGERRLDIIEIREFCNAIGLDFVQYVKSLELRIKNL